MRTALQEASSLARTLVLRRAVPQRIERQRVNSLFIGEVLVRQRIIVGPVSLCTVPGTLRSVERVKANCGDRVLHGGDSSGKVSREPKTVGASLLAMRS
jgi:hypothetical protein